MRALGEQCCKLLNVIPAKGGVSKCFSPHMIMNKTHLQCDKDFKHMIGDCGMANAPTDNTMKPRAVEAIHLRPVDGAQGGHECMHLQTGKRIQSTRFEPLLITETVMRHVEKLATKQGTLSFKITTRDGKMLCDSAQIAGVDDEASQNENDDENESTNEECEIHNEEFEEVEEECESTDDETSECSAASQNEANCDQNDDEENTTNNNNDDNCSEGINEDADGHSEGTNEDADGHSEGANEGADGQNEDDEDVDNTRPRRSARTTKAVERLDPQWKGKSYHQTKKNTQ